MAGESPVRTARRALGVAARRAVLALALSAAALAGCAGPQPAQPAGRAPSPSASPTPTPSPAPPPAPVQPLTGLPATGGVAQRPALVVKVDNTAAAAPQVGLSAADLVVEEPVEGGLTRLAAFFHSALPETVAPVRSVRGSDIGVAGPTRGALVASGGAGRVLRQIAEAGIAVATPADTPGFARAGDRRAPYNVTVRPAQVLTGSIAALPPPPPYLPWGPATGAQPGAAPVTQVSVAFSASVTARWTRQGEGWVREGDRGAQGDRFVPATLLVLRVTTRDAGYLDPAGNPVPEVVLAGTGEATLVTAAGAVPAWWSRDADPRAGLRLAGPGGTALGVPPGRAWIALVPEAGSVQVS